MTNESSKKKYILTREVYDAIRATILANKPEKGGFIGTSDGIHLDHYYFDHSADTTSSTYTPDTGAVNAVLGRWNANGVKLVGNIHSHPYGGHFPEPSEGDIIYAQRIMDTLDEDTFIVAILLHGGFHSDITLNFYEVDPFGDYERIELEYEREYKNDYIDDNHFILLDRLSYDRFARIKDLYPLDVLAGKKVVVVGVGGAISFIESLARSGVGNFVLIDPDIVSDTNIATSDFYITEIGHPKVEVARDRIYNINPCAEVMTICRKLDDKFCDEEFEELVGQNIFLSPKDILLCGCTDSFHAQARTANIAMKYGLPYIAAQLYARGEAAEIYFSYPGVTNSSCPRCALSSRYKAYENGFENDVTSEAAPVFATDRLNSLKGHIALMLLLYDEKRACRFVHLLDYVADRNFVLISMSPFASDIYNLRVFDDGMNPQFKYFDETLWLPQEPNNEENGYETCPLCGGTGDLLKLMGSIKDSRRA